MIIAARSFPTLNSAVEFAEAHDCYSPGFQQAPHATGFGIFGTNAKVFPEQMASTGQPSGNWIVFEDLSFPGAD